MRLLCTVTVDSLDILNMASSLGAPIATVERDTNLTLSQYKKEGNVGFYYCMEYNGWVPSYKIRVIRDIEFIHTSSMKKMMQNNAKANPIFLESFAGDLGNVQWNPSGDSGEQSGGSSGNAEAGEGEESGGGGFFGAITDTVNSFLGSDFVSGALDSISVDSIFNFGYDSVLGSILGGTSLGSILNGSFFSLTVLEPENLLNGLFSLLGNKLSYVVGHNFSSNWQWVTNLLGDLYSGATSGYRGGYFPQIPFFPQTAQMLNYFKYKGCDYKMITRSFGVLRWKQPASYSTPSLSSKPDPRDVALHKNLYNANYSEYKNAIDMTKRNVGLNMDRQDWFVNFNRYRLVHPDSVLSNSISYVFFTRPDLNLSVKGSGIINSSLGPFLYNMMRQHDELTKVLTKDYSSSHGFMPYLSNKVKSIDIQDEQIGTRDVGETLTGYKMMYGFHNIESITAGSMSITFDDDELLSTYLIFKIWTEYISAVSRGIVEPKLNYIRRKVLDYAIAIYYFLCGPDGESILFWTKFTGAFPTTVPSSNFSMGDGDRVKKPVHNISWTYAEKRDYNPYHLAEFNDLSGSGYTYLQPYSPDLLRSAPPLQGPPFVDTNTGGQLYKLRFRPPLKN